MLNKKRPGLIKSIASNINGLSKNDIGLIDNKKIIVVNKLDIATTEIPPPIIDSRVFLSLVFDDNDCNKEKLAPAEPIMEKMKLHLNRYHKKSRIMNNTK